MGGNPCWAWLVTLEEQTPAWVGGLLGVIGLGGGGFWAWLSSRRPGEAAYLTAVNSMAETFSRQMNELVAHQQKQISELEDTVENLKSEAANCRREGEELKGENRQLRQILGILVRKMREHGIDLPPEVAVIGLVEVEKDGLTVVAPVKGRRQ